MVAEDSHGGACARSWTRLPRAVRSVVSSAMFDYLILLCVGVAGLWQGRWWLILVGTLGLCIGSFADKWKMLRDHPLVPFDWKIASFLLASVGTALVGCSMATSLAAQREPFRSSCPKTARLGSDRQDPPSLVAA